MDTPEDPGTVTFEQHRRLLLAMGYRMLGSRAEAEELVQDTWLRWRTAPPPCAVCCARGTPT